MWMLTNELHHTEKMKQLSLDLEMHKIPGNLVRQINDGQRLFYNKIQIATPSACGGRYAGCWCSERPIFNSGRGCVHCPRRIKCYSKVPSDFMIGRFSWHIWGGSPFPSSISCETLFSSCLPPMTYFFQRLSAGVSQIAPHVYTSYFSALLSSILLLLSLQYLRLHFLSSLCGRVSSERESGLTWVPRSSVVVCMVLGVEYLLGFSRPCNVA